MNNKKNMRFTRRSYRRKLLIFGVSIFMSLALSATGFAAWVVSKNADVSANGSVEIGAVTEASIAVSDITFVEDGTAPTQKFVFEPKSTDTTGRVRHDGKNSAENLDVKFTWKVDNYQLVSDLHVDFKLPENVYKAIEKNWLALPSHFEVLNTTEGIEGTSYKVARYSIQTADSKITESGTKDGILSYTVTKDGDLVTSVTFMMTVNFTWGTAFAGENPGLYYDKDTEGKEIPLDQVKATLNEFKATLHGIPYDAAFEALSEDDKKALYEKDEYQIGNYYISIIAQVA